MAKELDGQLPLFEVANTTTVKVYAYGEPEPAIEQKYVDYVTWTDSDDEEEYDHV